MSGKRQARSTERQYSSHRTTSNRQGGWNWPFRASLAGGMAVLALLGGAILARRFAPIANTAQPKFDAIIVLGNPADNDGNPTPVQLARVTEAVREYERGVAPRLILTGGAVANRFTEARIMARSAEALGVPAAAIFIEPEAQNTIENACFAVRIMKAHGWRSVEIVSSPYHLPRAGMIFSRLPLLWRTHAAPPLEPQTAVKLEIASAVETLKTARYLIWARWTENCTP